MSKEYEELSRISKVFAFVLGTLAEMKVSGLVDGPDVVTEKGQKCFEYLKKIGFKPTDEEIAGTMFHLQNGILNEDRET